MKRVPVSCNYCNKLVGINKIDTDLERRHIFCIHRPHDYVDNPTEPTQKIN